MASLSESKTANVSEELNTATVSDATATDQSVTHILSPSIRNAVFAHLSRTFSVRELVQLKLVCKQFATLVSENSIFTERARYQDDSMDWYFPLRFTKRLVHPTPDASQKRKRASSPTPGAAKRQNRRSLWSWSGIHHPTQEIHTLPSLEHLPAGKIRFRDGSFGSLLAGSGSLLLFVIKTKNHYARGAWNNKNCLHPEMPSPWIPLIVSNPLTKEYRVLPAPANAKSTRWDYHGARAHLVEEDCANAYKVLLLFRDRLFVYKSSTKCWNSSVFHEPIPWGCRDLDLNFSDYLEVPCAIVEGKLLYAELEFDGNAIATQKSEKEMVTKGGVRLFEVDDKAGTWKPADRHALQGFIPKQLDLHDWDLDSNFQVGSYAIDIVKCMGGVYILIPASLDISMSVTEEIKQMYNLSDGAYDLLGSYKEFGFLPVRFYILQLQGNGLLCGQALIQIPKGMCNEKDLMLRMKYKLLINPYHSSRWYRCRGYGSAINIVVDECVTRYNVMTGVSTTQILTINPFFIVQPDVAYRPSLQRKP